MICFFVSDFAILFLKDLIRKGFYFFNAGTKPNYAQNGIFDVIYELLKQFNLTDFKTICNYINAAIQLLYKLLGCKQNKTLTPNKVKEITPNEKMSMIPTK